jgi:Chaperone of endosialidase
VILLGHLDNGLGFYRFTYNGGNKAYVGVIAQEVQQIVPQAVMRGHDGYLRVNYDMLGVKFETYKQWIGSGAETPSASAQRP